MNEIRDEAVSQYLNSFRSCEKKRIQDVTSLAALEARLEYDVRQFHGKSSVRLLNRVQPLIRWLAGFNECVKVFLQAAPREFVVVWGILSFLFEIAARFQRRGEQVLQVLEDIQSVAPRFTYYAETLRNTTYRPLRDALVSYHVVLTEVCIKSIRYVQGNAIVAFQPGSLQTQLTSLLAKLHCVSDRVDKEASVAYTTEILGDLRQGYFGRLRSEALDDAQELEKMLLIPSPYDNLPARQSHAFYGRKPDFDNLQFHLMSPQSPYSPNIACIYGLSGVGKTQLAQEFAYRHLDDYKFIFWIDCATTARLEESVRSICNDIGLADQNIQHPKQISPDIRWLMIFDNVEPDVSIESYFPRTVNGAIIITCRKSSISYQYAPQAQIALETFNAVESVGFLLNRLKMDPTNSEAELSEKITAAVGGLPLALDLIGSYIRECGMSLSIFLQEYPRFEENFMFSPDFLDWSKREHNKAVGIIWKRHLLELDNSTLLLAQMLAFMDASKIQTSIFSAHSRERMLYEGPDVQEEFPDLYNIIIHPFMEPYRALVTVHPHSNYLKIHRLIQSFILQSMDSPTKLKVFQQALFLLNGAFPTQEHGKALYEDWLTCAALSNHVTALFDSYHRHKTDLGYPLLLCEIASRCAWYFKEFGQYEAANRMADDSIALCESALKTSNHPGYSKWFVKEMICTHLNVKAAIAAEYGEEDHGLPLFQEIEKLRVLNMRPNSAEDETWYQAARANTAYALMGYNCAPEALAILQEILDRDDMQPNKDLYLVNTSICLRLQGDLTNSLEQCQEAMTLAEERRGKDSSQMASCHFQLGTIFLEESRIADALREFIECFRIRSSVMPTHPFTAFVSHKIGSTLQVQDSHAEAIRHYLTALNILRTSETHPLSICRTLLALASAYEAIGNNAATEKCIHEALEGFAAASTYDFDCTTKPTLASSFDSFVPISHR
ncbi:hypothetical protein JX266_008187 [Neoarthrinium moseri]|nr:hypothetical protein JX266_008187 [Neoarthrinium moseri]